MSTNQQEMEQDLTFLKKAVSSQRRKALHHHCFGFFPRVQISPSSTLMYSGHDFKSAHPKLMRAILQLTSSRAIISRYQHHFTTWNNLESIINAGAFYGQDTLRRLGIVFEPNSLAESDRINGDGDVICFSPYLVDSMAFCTKGSVKPKEGAIRITIDVDAINPEGRYHQFFKLIDLGCPELNEYCVHVNDRLSFSLSRWRSIAGPREFVAFDFIFDGNRYSTILLDSSDQKSKSESLIYGSLYMINRFCLLKFIEFLDSIANKSNKPGNALFVKEFLEYMDALDESEIKKVLVLFGQTLTVFSEMNFNGNLQLSKHLITAIHDLNHSSTFDLSKIGDKSYKECIDFSEKSIHSCALTSVSVSRESILTPGAEELYHEEQCPFIYLYGVKISHLKYSTLYRISPQDFRAIDPECFASNDYFESRAMWQTTSVAQTACRP